MIKYCIALLICLCVVTAHAQQHVSSARQPTSPRRYYLNALQGNDQLDGLTPATAWRTLSRANQPTYTAGDSLLLHAAMIFEGQLKPTGSGRAQLPIVLSSYGQGAKPEIQGNGVMPAALFLYNVEHWTVHNIHVTNFGAERAASRYGILVKISNYGVASGIHILQTTVSDVNGSLVKKEGGGAAIVFANEGNRKYSWYDDISIEHCTLQRTARNGILINGYWQRNNWHPNLHLRIQNNLLEGIPGDGIVPIGCDSALIAYNTMRNCPRLLPPGEAAAGIWPWSCDNTIIQYNEVSDHKAPWDAQGFDSDWNCRNTLIQYNYSHDNEGGFLLVCNDGGVKMPISAGNTGTIVRFNVSCNDGFRTTGKDSGFSPVIHIPGPARNTHIYNNLIYISNRQGLQSDSTLISFDNWGGYADSTVFANNIFYTTTPVDYQYGKAKRITFSNNLYYGVHIGKPQDAYAVLEDPFFQQPQLAGKAGWASLQAFLLSKHSPAIGAGKAVTEQSAKDLYEKKMQATGKTNIGVDAF